MNSKNENASGDAKIMALEAQVAALTAERDVTRAVVEALAHRFCNLQDHADDAESIQAWVDEGYRTVCLMIEDRPPGLWFHGSAVLCALANAVTRAINGGRKS